MRVIHCHEIDNGQHLLMQIERIRVAQREVGVECLRFAGLVNGAYRAVQKVVHVDVFLKVLERGQLLWLMLDL